MVGMDLKTNSDYFSIQHYLIGFITETERVYRAVRTVYLNVTSVNLSLHSMINTVCK